MYAGYLCLQNNMLSAVPQNCKHEQLKLYRQTFAPCELQHTKFYIRKTEP